MAMFIIKNNVPKPSPEMLVIPQFRALWDRDNHRHKTSSVEDLAYVYYMMDWQSPYRAYPPEERGSQLRKDIIKRSRWKEDDLIKAAMVKYDEMQMTPSMRYLKAIESTMEEMVIYFENVNFNPEKKKSDGTKVPLSDIKKVTEAVTKASALLKSINELKDRVRKEQDTIDNIRGGGSIGIYED